VHLIRLINLYVCTVKTRFNRTPANRLIRRHNIDYSYVYFDEHRKPITITS